MKVLTCSRHFPKGHPKAGQPTWFVESILNSILRQSDGSLSLDDIMPAARPYVNDFQLIGGELYKHHTIRAGNRWKSGDMASLRIWSGMPYRSKQIEFAHVEVTKVLDVEIIIETGTIAIIINGKVNGGLSYPKIARNDGLEYIDFVNWFNIHPKKKDQVFRGQIICWRDKIDYP
jgi:hypothetical protein